MPRAYGVKHVFDGVEGGSYGEFSSFHMDDDFVSAALKVEDVFYFFHPDAVFYFEDDFPAFPESYFGGGAGEDVPEFFFGRFPGNLRTSAGEKGISRVFFVSQDEYFCQSVFCFQVFEEGFFFQAARVNEEEVQGKSDFEVSRQVFCVFVEGGIDFSFSRPEGFQGIFEPLPVFSAVTDSEVNQVVLLSSGNFS